MRERELLLRDRPQVYVLQSPAAPRDRDRERIRASVDVGAAPRNGKSTHLDEAGVRDDRLELDGVDQGLAQRDLLDARVVEPVDVVPDCATCGMQISDRPAGIKTRVPQRVVVGREGGRERMTHS